MKFKNAINGTNGNAWKQEVKKQQKQMIKHDIWRLAKKSQVPKGEKIFGSVWCMKKKGNGTLQAGSQHMDAVRQMENSTAALQFTLQ